MVRRWLGLGPVFSPGVAWMFLACGVALALGLFRLGQPGFWCDEIYTARWMQLTPHALLDALRQDLHPPLYFLLEHLAARMLGSNEAGLRLLGLLSGVGTVALAFWAFRPVLNERLVAASACFLALSPEFFLYARMARYYSFAALVAMLSHGLFVRLAVGRGRPRSWWLYGISVALALYASYVCVCLIVAHGVWAFVARRRRELRLRYLASTALGLLLFSPWAGALAAQMKIAHGLLPSVARGPSSLILTLVYDLHALTTSEMHFPWEPLGLVGIVCGGWLMFMGVLAGIRRGLGRSLLLPAAAALALAWLVVAVMAHATPFVGLPARTLFLWPFGAAIIALGALDPINPRGLRWAATAGLLLAWSMAWFHLYRAEHYLNPIYLTPGREVARDIIAAEEKGDAVLAEDDTGAEYYLRRGGFQGTIVDPIDGDGVDSLLAAGQASRIWWVRLGRDGSARLRPSLRTENAVSAWGREDLDRGYLEIDPSYVQFKHRLLGLEGYSHRIRLQRFVAKSP